MSEVYRIIGDPRKSFTAATGEVAMTTIQRIMDYDHAKGRPIDKAQEFTPLPVAGYIPQPQPQSKIDVVNINKVLEEKVLRQIDAMVLRHKENSYDPRMIALAKTQIEQGFMWLNRAVFQPVRIELSDDSSMPAEGLGK